MTKATHRWLVTGATALLLLASACVATPLPTPPNADPDRFVAVANGDGSMDVSGRDGAVEPPGSGVRITMEFDPTTVGLPTIVETTTGVDGSFAPVEIAYSSSLRYYVEVIIEDDDVFVLAFTVGPGTGVTRASPGSDRDFDGSPDDIDCAPDDPTLWGRRCP